MNWTIPNYIRAFMVLAAFSHLAAFLSPVSAVAANFIAASTMTDVRAQASPESPAQQETTSQPPQELNAPSPQEPPAEERKEPAAEIQPCADGQPSVPPPNDQNKSAEELPQMQGPPWPPPSNEQHQGMPSRTDETLKKTTIIDVVHDELSRRILSTATWLDSFFGDRRYESELNRSHVRFRYNVFLEEDTGPLHKPDLEVRMVLPQLQEKTHLIISGAPREGNEFSAIQSNSTTDQFTTTGEPNVTTAVHYQARETAQESFIVRAGLKLHHGSPAIMLGPRYRVLFTLDSWALRLVEDVAWRSDTGWLSRSTIDLERPLPHDLFFRTSTEWVHTEHVNGYIYTLSYVIREPLSFHRALEYEWVNIFQTRPVNELTEVDLRVRYRQRIWRDWLYFELAPQYRFPRDRGFEATPGILFRLDAIFGSLT